jgi:hypothetical protein
MEGVVREILNKRKTEQKRIGVDSKILNSRTHLLFSFAPFSSYLNIYIKATPNSLNSPQSS